MRFLERNDNGELSLTKDFGDDNPRYAILSHTWGDEAEEVTFKDLMDGTGKSAAGYDKIRFCGEQAERDGLHYFWVDTCCIDKSNDIELSEAINSMFHWYQNAAKCYVYLSDMSSPTVDVDDEHHPPPWESAFRRSRWFTRGWTLQELIAPKSVEFFSQDWKNLGNKASLEILLSEITGIPVKALQGAPLSDFSITERMSWVGKRETTRKEDMAYSLLGIFDVHMQLLYGEGVEEALNRLQEKIQKGVVKMEGYETAVFDWLTPIDYASQQKDFVSRRQVGTGQWLLDSTEFKTWVETDKQTLFCPGMPGAGKTILSSIIIEYLYDKFRNENTQSDGNIGIAYLYCNFWRQNEQNANDLLASLLKQLSQMRSFLPESVKNFYEHHQNEQTRPSVDELSRTLQSVVAMYSRVFIIIDALDECQLSDNCLMRLLPEIFKIQAESRVNVCATSRFVLKIAEYFEGGISIEIRASNDDVRRFLNDHMWKLPSFVTQSPDLQEEIQTRIIQSVRGKFVLAQLHLDSLLKKTSPEAIQAVLAKLPIGSETYDYAYKQALGRIEGQVAGLKHLAKKVLSWITYAKRPLTIMELQHALAVEVGESKLKIENLLSVDDLVSTCSGLVVVDKETGIIRLNYYITPEYFERTQKRWFPDAGTDIATICLTYLSFSRFGSGFCESDEAFEERLLLNPLYNYAAQNWGNHVRDIPNLCHGMIEFLKNQPNVEASIQALMAVKGSGRRNYSQDIPKQVVGLHLAAYFGLREAVDTLLGHWRIEVCDSYGQTPLLWAVQGGQQGVIRLLLEKSADIEAKDHSGQTALLRAAENGHDNVVYLLLEKGAKVDVKEEHGWTALSLAAGNGQRNVVWVLLNYTDDIEARDHSNKTALLQAVENGHDSVVYILLEKGAKVNVKEEHGQTALSLAAENGQRLIVWQLLEMGAEVDVRDERGRTPLSIAAENGHTFIVWKLLEKGADIETRNSSGQTVLLRAAENGHKDVVWQLLKKGAKVDVKEEHGWTALSLAAENGHSNIVWQLIKKGAKVDIREEHGRTPLLIAAENGRESVVWYLLKTGAEVDVREEHGRTPLLIAAENGHRNVVWKLLNTAVDIEARDHSNKTALLQAVKNGHDNVVYLLLEKGAEVDVKEEHGRTPLSIAAEMGHTAVVSQLLEMGADIKARDLSNQTAVLRAIENGHEAVVQLLIDHRANRDLKNRRASTAIRNISSPSGTEDSDSSTNNDSVSSAPNSLPSTMTLGSGTGGIDVILIQEFAALLSRDEALISLIVAAVSKRPIGFKRIRNNFQKLLKYYAKDLKVETLNSRHRALVGFVSSYSTDITQELFTKTSISCEEAQVRILESTKNTLDVEDRRKKVEEHSQKRLDYKMSAESAELGTVYKLITPDEVNERDEDSESDDESGQDSVEEVVGEEEPYDGSLKHLDQTKRFILDSFAYQMLLRRLHDFIHPSLRSRLRDLVAVWSRPDHKYHADVTRYKLSNLVAELQYIHPSKVRFGDGEGYGNRARRFTSYCQNVVECWTGEHWDWWPLAPCLRPLKQMEARIRWRCTCGEERWTEVPRAFARRLESIIRNLPNEIPKEVIPKEVIPKEVNPMQDMQPPSIPRLPNSGTQNAHGTGDVPGQSHEGGQRSKQSGGPSSANKLNSPPSILRGRTTDVKIPSHRILFIVKQSAEYKLAQICVNGLSCHTFFSVLRDNYFHLRGFLRGWFSVWRYSHCDFYRFEKFDDHEYTPKHKNAFPGVANTDYEYQPKPMDSIPPVSEHEFKKRFYDCHQRHQLLHWYHTCKRLGLQSHDLLKLLPKKRTELEEGGDKREQFWGIYAREIISLRWVLFYNFVCVLPMLVFFMVWVLPLGHRTDLQDPSIPVSMMIAMLSLFWSAFLSSLQFGKPH